MRLLHCKNYISNILAILQSDLTLTPLLSPDKLLHLHLSGQQLVFELVGRAHHRAVQGRPDHIGLDQSAHLKTEQFLVILSSSVIVSPATTTPTTSVVMVKYEKIFPKINTHLR